MIVSTNVGGGAQPQLYAPTISISGRTLTITPNSNNGSFGESFAIYDGNTLVDTVAKSVTTVDLDDYFSTVGSHSISVKMTGEDFKDSNASNSVSYALYSVSVSVIDGTATYSNMISNHETAVITLEADEGYVLPASVTVSGATSAYDSNAGTITLSSATGNVTVSVVCEEAPSDLEHTTWAKISQISADGQGANYFSVGDTKSITLNGTVGTLELNNYATYVYIIGFDHNSAVEGTGISFGCFKSAATGGIDVALCDSHYGSESYDGSKWFNMNHYGNANDGGWKDCQLRYDILGSVEVRRQQNATEMAVTNPVANTLMAALPSDLRAVLKPVTKCTDNVGGGSTAVADNITSTVDYLFLLSEYEIFGRISWCNPFEESQQAQYTYYVGTNSVFKRKYNHGSTSSAVRWWERSVSAASSNRFCFGSDSSSGGSNHTGQAYSYGLSPAFVV